MCGVRYRRPKSKRAGRWRKCSRTAVAHVGRKTEGSRRKRRLPFVKKRRKKLLLLCGLLLRGLLLCSLFLGSHCTISCYGVNSLAIPRWIAGSRNRVFRGPVYTASDRLVKLKSRTFKDGIAIAPPCSVPARRSDLPSASKLFSMNSGDSLNRMFCTLFEILPFSIKNVPSRVNPV